MTMTPVDHFWSLTFLTFLLVPFSLYNYSAHATPINRQVGISENVFITTQNDTYGFEQRVCSIDSMTYGDGETIPTASPCEHCVCRPPGFACTIISCEYRPGCKAFKRSNQCCPEYQCECEKDGKIYQNGEKIMDSNNPCEICYCQGGEIVCAVIDCYWRSDCQPRYIENRCCPLYDHCPPPPNQGPYQRPTIPTTAAPAASFPWFNLSSAVYELPAGSSPTPLPNLELSTNPTTTPIPPELVVIATQKTPVEINILATAQEEPLVNNVSSIQTENESTLQEVKVATEAPVVLDGQSSNAPSGNDVHISQSSEAPVDGQQPVEIPAGQQPPEVPVVDQQISEIPVAGQQVPVIDQQPSEVPANLEPQSEKEVDTPVNQVVNETVLDSNNIVDIEPSPQAPKDSTTIFAAPAIAISIIPSPVEDILVTSDAQVVTPEIASQVKDEESLPNTVSQSENAVPVDDGLIQPTETLPNVVSSLETETVGHNGLIEPTLVDTVIAPSSVESDKNFELSSDAPQLPEVTTTGAPQQAVDDAPSNISQDENIPIVEESYNSVEQTTADKTPELSATDTPIVQPVPSISTIIMPPKRNPVEPEVTTNNPVVQDETPADLVAPSIDLQPPTQEFLPGSHQDETEVTTNASNDFSSPVELDIVVDDEPAASPTTGSPILSEEKVVSDEVASVTQLPLAVDQETTVKVEEIIEPALHDTSDSVVPEVSKPQSSVSDESLAYLPIKKVEKPVAELAEVVTTNAPSEQIVSDDKDDVTQQPSSDPSQEPEVEYSTPSADSISDDEVSPTVASVPMEVSKETHQDESVKVQSEPIIPTTSLPETLESSTEAQPSKPIEIVPLNTNVNTLIDEDTFEIIPPQSDNDVSSPEILSQIRDPSQVLNAPVGENEIQPSQQVEPLVVQTTPASINTKTEMNAWDDKEAEKSSDDDTIEILAGNLHTEDESTTDVPVVDKLADQEVHDGQSNLQNDGDKIESVNTAVKQEANLGNELEATTPKHMEEEDDSEHLDRPELDDVPEDEPGHEIVTTEDPALNDEVQTTILPIQDALPEIQQSAPHEDSVHSDQPDLSQHVEEESHHEEIHQDEPTHLDQEDESVLPTTETPVQNDDSSLPNNDAELPFTTTVQPVGINKVQKVAEVLKSNEEIEPDLPLDSSSDSKFRFDLTSFEDSVENAEEIKKKSNVPSSDEVQSTPTPLIAKVVNDEVVFDEAQQVPTHLPLADSTQETNTIQTTERSIKLSRDDMELSDLTTTGSPKYLLERQDGPEGVTTENPARSESITDVPTTSSSFIKSEEADEVVVNDEESVPQTTTTKTAENLFRQEEIADRTTVSTTAEEVNKYDDTTSISADASFNDFVEVTTGSPSGFAAEYRDDNIQGETTTLRGSFKAEPVTELNDEVVNDITTFETPVFDEVQKVYDESAEATTRSGPMDDKAKAESIEVATTFEPIGDKAKSESIETTTTFEPIGDKAKAVNIEATTTFEVFEDKAKSESVEVSTTYDPIGDKAKAESIEISTTYQPEEDKAKAENIEVTTTYEPLSDKAKSENIEITTTYRSIGDKAKAESLEIATTFEPEDDNVTANAEILEDQVETTTSNVLQDDLDNGESTVVTTEVAYAALSDANETLEDETTTAKELLKGLNHMIIPAKGFPAIDPVSPDMIPEKTVSELNSARIDLNENWLYQTYNKIRQLSGLFPTNSRTQKKLVRQPRDVQNKNEEHPPSKPSKTLKKTKKATEDPTAKSKRKSILPNRSFLFF